jgi:hypothetical protein
LWRPWGQYFLGDTYRAYQEIVPGYPFMPFGPLARGKRRNAQVIPLPSAMTMAVRKAA